MEGGVVGRVEAHVRPPRRPRPCSPPMRGPGSEHGSERCARTEASCARRDPARACAVCQRVCVLPARVPRAGLPALA
eukprot:2151554-Rhodomonas_salina.1